ncbi:ABA4-like family protein [Geminocystis herdmanii]|uniref:ABA4-like family protein n=1 Tax=Geminocystis herdmanii TaxID=669359 RepID=UPI0003742F1D|nr:ABA4-like family protein [Geminocystis herdmanii]
MDLNLLFNLANLFVLPFWLLMIFLPNWGFTQKIMKSYLLFLPLIFLYIYLFITGLNPDSIEVLSNPQLVDLAKVFSDPTITFAGWVHFLVLDLFLGRYIYQQGQTEKIWTIHSLILCLFAGPMGFLSHIITRTIQLNIINKKDLEVTI